MAEPVIGLAQPRLAVTSISLHLAAAALAIVIGVLAFAVRPDRAGIVDVVAKLADVLDHHVHAVRVALAQMPAGGVVRPLAAQPRDAGGDIFAALALLAEAVILQLQHRGEGERVIGAGGVDILGPNAGIRPQDVLRIVAGDAGDRSVLVMHVHARLAAASDDAADQRRRMAQVLARSAPGDDDRGGVVGLDAAIQQMQRLADDPAAQHVIHRVALLVIRLRIVRCVLGVDHLHHRHLLRLACRNHTCAA